jgi:hypothetical protein
MSHSFNEFQKELNKYVTDQGLRYLFTLVYERMSETARQVDQSVDLMVTFASALEKITHMHQSDQKTVGELARRAGLINKPAGVDVQSVANEPDDV